MVRALWVLPLGYVRWVAAFSISVDRTPLDARSRARTIPTGPAPTITTGVSTDVTDASCGEGKVVTLDHFREGTTVLGGLRLLGGLATEEGKVNTLYFTN